MSLNFLENIKSEIDINVLKTSSVIFVINVAISYAIIYYLQQDELMAILSRLAEYKLPSTKSYPMALPVILALVVSYLAYKHMVHNVQYTDNIVNNLKVYYQNVKHILINVLPFVVIYMVNSTEIYDDANTDEIEILTKSLLDRQLPHREISPCGNLQNDLSFLDEIKFHKIV